MSNANFADVNGQHIFYSAHGTGKPLILLHGGINPDCFGDNVAELAKGRQVIALHLQAHGRTPDTDRPLRSVQRRLLFDTQMRTALKIGAVLLSEVGSSPGPTARSGVNAHDCGLDALEYLLFRAHTCG